MFKKILFIGFIAILFVNISLLFAQTPGEPITLPDDVPIFGGLSLSLALTMLVGLLTYFKVISDKNKKFIGYGLAVVGFLAAGFYAYQTGLRDIELLKVAFAGVFIGLGAVGMNSAWKNGIEGIRVQRGLPEKKSSNQ